MKTKLNLTMIFALCAVIGFAQETKEEFKPSGKPLAKVYANFNTELSEGSENENGFELSRVYLGYKYNMSENFSAKVNLDVADPGNGLAQTAYIKTAALSYKKGNLKVDFGLIGLKQFKLQESTWGHRYIAKSFQDAYKFGSSADLGISVDYKLHDMVSVDATVMNGEGYKKLQGDNAYKTGFGLTFKPIKGLSVRGYYDFIQTPGTEMQSTIATFVGYKKDKIAVGAEYNMQMANKGIEDQDWAGISAYASYDLSKKHQVFARFDQLSSKDDWNIAGTDVNVIIAGFQCTPIKNVKVALSYQGFQPADEGADMISSAFVNFQYAF